MNVQTIQNQPVLINFEELLNDRSWVLSGNKATHYPCNVNSVLKLLTYEIEPNVDYAISFNIIAMNSSPQLQVGFDTPLHTYTTAQSVNIVLNTTQTGDKLTFWGSGYIEIESINIQRESALATTKSRNTVTWSEGINRWIDFRPYRPEGGFSMFSDLFTCKNGQLWIHNDSENYNNFYGQQFQTVVDMPLGTGQIKTWQSVAIHSNNLMVTTTDGITTQLGHVSDLVELDFSSREGIHYANLLRDKLTDIINGDRLKGRFLTIELITVDGSKKLQLFKVTAKYAQSTANEG